MKQVICLFVLSLFFDVRKDFFEPFDVKGSEACSVKVC